MSSAPAGQRSQHRAAAAPGRPPAPPAPPAREPAAAPAQLPARAWPATAAACAPPAAAAAVMAVLGLWGLARESSMGNDEVATRWAALLSLRQLGHLLRNVDAVHGLYYLLMHGWMAVGTSPTVMRVPSVISMTAAVAVTAVTGRRLTGSGWAGLLAGLIMALTPAVSYYAQTARSYALVLACVTGSTLALLRALEAEAGPGAGARITRRWLPYGALVAAGGYLNELSLLVLTAHAVTVLLAGPGRRAAAHWAAASAAAVALVVPLMVISSREDGAVTWIARPGLADLRVLFHDYFGATTVVAVLLAACAVAAALPGGWPRRQRDRPGAGPRWRFRGEICLPSVAAPLLALPASVLIAESLVAHPLYVDRYVLFGEAGAALMAGAGAYRIGRWLRGKAGARALIWLPGVAICLCALVLQLAPQQRIRTPQSRLFDFGGPARYVAANARGGDGILFLTSFYRKARLGYPREFEKTSDFALAAAPVQTGTFRGRDKPFEVIRPLMLARRRIWVVGRLPSALLGVGPAREESMVLLDRFRLIRERRFRGIVVTLWLRRQDLLR